MVHHKLIKVTINTLRHAKVIIDIVIKYHDLPNSIIRDRGAIFISKFWFSLYYFFDIKKQLFTTF